MARGRFSRRRRRWKSAVTNVFDRYHIISERKMRQNGEKLENYLKGMDAEADAKRRESGPVEIQSCSKSFGRVVSRAGIEITKALDSI
jgi:hypothetical protein